jgi:hypothetical protein
VEGLEPTRTGFGDQRNGRYATPLEAVQLLYAEAALSGLPGGGFLIRLQVWSYKSGQEACSGAWIPLSMESCGSSTKAFRPVYCFASLQLTMFSSYRYFSCSATRFIVRVLPLQGNTLS